MKFPQLKLIVLDTFCEHLKMTEHGFAERKRTVSQWLNGMQKVAAKFNIAVVVVNNMKTGRREMQNTSDGQRDFAPAKPEPCFGEDLFQAVTSRVMLERDQHSTEDNIIRARLIKGSVATHFTANPTTHFQVTEKGIANIY